MILVILSLHYKSTDTLRERYYLAERFQVWHTFLCGYFVVSSVALPCEWQSFYSCTRKGFSRKEAIKRWVFHCIIFLCLVLLRLNVSDGKCVFVTLDIFISYLFKLVGKCIFLHNWPPSSHLTVDGVRSLGRIFTLPQLSFLYTIGEKTYFPDVAFTLFAIVPKKRCMQCTSKNNDYSRSSGCGSRRSCLYPLS